MAKIPLIILNGTLGSGKTTLVRRLLRSSSYAGSFLIENEFANVNIDRDAIADEHDDEIYEISGSCICCSTGEELEAALETVVAKGWTKPVILEATGMANSAILLRRLFLNPTFADNFQILSTVLLIDAAETDPEKLGNGLAVEIKLSDVVIVNKADIAPGVTDEITRAVLEVNPDATVITATEANIDLDILSERDSNAEIAFAKVFPELDDIELDVATYAVLDLEGPINAAKVRSALRPDSFPTGIKLRRAKGFFVDEDGSWNQVEATAKHIEIRKLNKPKQAVIVAIGDGMTKAALKEVLA